MTIRYLLIISILLFISCEKELHNLSMYKSAYAGDELRINGYYYSNTTSANDVGIAVFYKDGVCIHMYTRIESQNMLDFIENEILLNDALISRLMNTPTHIGVFQINTKSINFEIWEAGRNITTFSHFGKILNDTTFLLEKRINNITNKTFTENLTYRFKQFSPKPNSTNNFIK